MIQKITGREKHLFRQLGEQAFFLFSAKTLRSSIQ